MQHEKSSTDDSSRGSATSVIVVLMTVATAMGVLAFWRFSESDRFLSHVMGEMEGVGKSASAEQCVDEVVKRAATCEAMKSLCDASAPRWMGACLRGQDRAAYCSRLGDKPKATSFGFKACKDRHVDRRTKSACASAYRSIAAHCDSIAKGEQWVSSSSR